MQNIALSALADGDLIFWRFHGFEKQLPHLVHSLSQFYNIFGIHAVGAVDSLANLIYIDPDFVDFGSKFALLRVVNFYDITVDQHLSRISML